jgi:hypothetical protein
MAVRERLRRRSVRGAHDPRWDFARGLDELRSYRKPQLRVENHTERAISGGISDGKPRVVGQGRTHADDDCIVLGAQEMHARPGFGSGDPFGCACTRGDAAVEREGQLESHVRDPGGDELSPRTNESLGLRLAAADVDAHARLTEPCPPSASHVRVRVAASHHYACHAVGENRVDARGSAALVVARLESDVEGGPSRSLACLP